MKLDETSTLNLKFYSMVLLQTFNFTLFLSICRLKSGSSFSRRAVLRIGSSCGCFRLVGSVLIIGFRIGEHTRYRPPPRQESQDTVHRQEGTRCFWWSSSRRRGRFLCPSPCSSPFRRAGASPRRFWRLSRGRHW